MTSFTNALGRTIEVRFHHVSDSKKETGNTPRILTEQESALKDRLLKALKESSNAARRADLEEAKGAGYEDQRVFAKEIICGKCTAPLFLFRLTKKDYLASHGSDHTDFVKHTPAKASLLMLEAREKGYLRLKLVEKTCDCCCSSSI